MSSEKEVQPRVDNPYLRGYERKRETVTARTQFGKPAGVI